MKNGTNHRIEKERLLLVVHKSVPDGPVLGRRAALIGSIEVARRPIRVVPLVKFAVVAAARLDLLQGTAPPSTVRRFSQNLQRIFR